ncbi:metalloregulator ArsR/SmtB family transcription factor [bacterium]|nr:metalloregulator ArsR/SmtB family transcription factor [bacterium]
MASRKQVRTSARTTHADTAAPSSVKRSAGATSSNSAGGGEPFDHAADVMKALSHPTRLRIVHLLGGGELCVSRLEELLGVPQPSVSQHLQRLKYAGLIEAERRGHLVCYRLLNESAAAILDLLLPGADPHS